MNFTRVPCYTFQVAPDMQFESSQGLYLMNALLTLEPVVFQVVARAEGIQWQVINVSQANVALDSLKAHHVAVLPSVFATQAGHRPYPFFRGRVHYVTYAAANRPILYITDMRGESDPLLQLAQTCSFLKENEEIRYSIMVTRQYKPPFYRGLEIIDQLSKIVYDDPPSHTFEKVIEHKQNRPWFESLVTVEVDSPNFKRVASLRRAVDLLINGCFDRHFPNHPLNGLRSLDYPRIHQVYSAKEDEGTAVLGLYERSFRDREIARGWEALWMYFEAAELAALWHLPHREFTGTNVAWWKPRPVLGRTLAQNPEGVVLGQAPYQDEKVRARMDEQDRVTHMNIVGRTGVGKSTLLHNLVRQDIAGGKGVAVIDPHGKLVQDILRCSIPTEREQDVVVLDLGSPEYPIPLNIFAGAQSYAAIGRVVDMVERLSVTTGVRMDKYLRAGIRVLQGVPHATMKDLYRLLTDDHFRYDLLEHLEDDELFQTLHNEYHLLSEGKRNEIRAPILNRISPFYANPYLYPTLCHPQRIDLGELIEQRKIILIALGVNAEVVPKQERDLVGSLFISLLQMAGMSAGRTPTPFYVYVDEVQNFVTTSLEVVFSEARKYGLSMTVAHQFFGQLTSETLQAIMGNVGGTIAFRSNVDDARALAPYMQPSFDVPALVNLDKYQAVVKMQHKGETQAAFLLYADPPPKEPANAGKREAYLRALSVQQYTPMNREAVLAWLNSRYPLRRRNVTPPPNPLDSWDDFSEPPDFADSRQ